MSSRTTNSQASLKWKSLAKKIARNSKSFHHQKMIVMMKYLFRKRYNSSCWKHKFPVKRSNVGWEMMVRLEAHNATIPCFIFEKSNEKKVSKNLVSKDYTFLYEGERESSFNTNTNKKLKIPSAPQEIHSFLVSLWNVRAIKLSNCLRAVNIVTCEKRWKYENKLSFVLEFESNNFSEQRLKRSASS